MPSVVFVENLRTHFCQGRTLWDFLFSLDRDIKRLKKLENMGKIIFKKDDVADLEHKMVRLVFQTSSVGRYQRITTYLRLGCQRKVIEAEPLDRAQREQAPHILRWAGLPLVALVRLMIVASTDCSVKYPAGRASVAR
jgi:hypothetical protein